MGTTLKEYVNRLEWGAGYYVVDIHLLRPVRQLSSTEEALKKGYFPYTDPRSWAIGASKWRIERTEKGYINKIFAGLKLDSIDVPEGVEAYVASGIRWEDESVNDHFIISAQYYKKLAPSVLEQLIKDNKDHVRSKRQKILQKHPELRKK
jgi:hypothetical protein